MFVQLKLEDMVDDSSGDDTPKKGMNNYKMNKQNLAPYHKNI